MFLNSFFTVFIVIAGITMTACSTQKQNSAGVLTGLKIRINTPLLEQSRFFYADLLGMKVIESWDEGDDKGVIFGLAGGAQGQAFLELGYAQSPGHYQDISVQIRVNNLEQIIAGLAGKVDFSGPKLRPWGSKYLYLKDPTGVAVILYEGTI